MKQKINYRIITAMGTWLAYVRISDKQSSQSLEYRATRAMPDNGKYKPMQLTIFRCDHVVEVIPQIVIEIADGPDNSPRA